MTRGRRPKPTHLKVVEGSKPTTNKAEPKPKLSLPDPPAHLDDEAVAHWNEKAPDLYRLGLLSDIDQGALACMCVAWSTFVRAALKLTEMRLADRTFGGLIIKTKNDNIIQNPILGTMNKAMADYMRYAIEFGMTPSARSRIDAEIAARAQDLDPAEEFFA